jgi:hypothetical protein
VPLQSAYDVLEFHEQIIANPAFRHHSFPNRPGCRLRAAVSGPPTRWKFVDLALDKIRPMPALDFSVAKPARLGHNFAEAEDEQTSSAARAFAGPAEDEGWFGFAFSRRR